MALELGQSHPGLIKRVRADGRRVYEMSGKLAMVHEARRPGVSVARVALDHGVNANLLRKWILRYGKNAGVGDPEAATPALLPVVIKRTVKTGDARRPAPKVTDRSPIEIELPRGMVRFYGAIDALVLRMLIEALSAR